MQTQTSLTIGEAAEFLGEYARTIRDLLSRGLFPSPDGEREGIPASWRVDTLEAWRTERDSRAPAEPFFMSDEPISRERCGATLRRLAMLGLNGRVWLDTETGRHSLVFPTSRERVGRMASRFATEAPRFRVVLIDSEPRKPAAGWLDIPADGVDVAGENAAT